jgi:hypothetical protein
MDRTRSGPERNPNAVGHAARRNQFTLKGEAMKRLLVACIVSIVGLGIVSAAPAIAKGSGEDAIKIVALASAPLPDNSVCPETLSTQGANRMTGSLVGCWYGDTSTPATWIDNGNGTYTGSWTGTEHFVGCIDRNHDGKCGRHDPSGTWITTYSFTGLFSLTAELSGGCTHPIVSGTGDFKGAKGTIFMTDNVNDGTSNVTGFVMLRDD